MSPSGRLGVVVVIAGLLAAGCGSTTVIKQATETVTRTSAVAGAGAATTGATPAAAQTTSRPAARGPRCGSSSARQARAGDALTLSGDSGGESLAVTADGVMDPLAVGEFDQADPGQRFVGVQVTLQNVGTVPYSDSPSNGATLLSSDDEQAQSEIVTGGPCANGFGSDVKIAPGDSQQGCVAFELPDGATPATFQFTLDSGFADDTGQWSLAGAGSAGGSTSAAETTEQPTVPQQTTTDEQQPVPAAHPRASTASDGGPLQALQAYWSAINDGDYSAAYGWLAPGVASSESDFVAGEQSSHVRSASFSGHVVSDSGSRATVDVDSLVTHEHADGCTNWSGSYELSLEGGRWLIAKAAITPSSCG
jgi:hypothetical protein